MTSKLPTALITGSSSGIGRYLAIHLSKTNRYQIALFGRNIKSLEETYEMMKYENKDAKGQIFPLDFEINDTNIIKDTINDCCQNFGDGHLSLLINSAGIGSSGHIQDIDLNETDKMIDVNIRSVIHTTKHCVPYLIKKDELDVNNNKGIINIGSLSSLPINIGVDRSIYCATKHALKGFSDCLYADLCKYGIKVCCVMPHFINTKMIDKIERNHFLLPYKDELIQPSDIGKTIDYVLSCSPFACPTEILIRTQKKFV